MLGKLFVALTAVVFTSASCSAATSQNDSLTTAKGGSTFVEQWRYRAATMVSDLIVPQDVGAALATPYSARLTETLAAAIVLHPNYQYPDLVEDVVKAFDKSTGLFSADDVDQLYTTWLAVRWLYSLEDGMNRMVDEEKLVLALEKNLSPLASKVVQGDTAAAAQYVWTKRSLQVLSRPHVQDLGSLCTHLHAAVRAEQLVNAALWIELGGQDVSCGAVAQARRLAESTLKMSSPTFSSSGAAQIAAAASILALAGIPIPPLKSCDALFMEAKGKYLPQRPAAVYLACLDAYSAAGTSTPISPTVTEILQRIVNWRGSLSGTDAINAFGLIASVRALQGLKFRFDVISDVSQAPLIRGSGPLALDDVLISTILKGKMIEGHELIDLVRLMPSDSSLYQASILSAIILASKTCVKEATQALAMLLAGAAQAINAQEALYQAMMIKVIEVCKHTTDLAHRRQHLVGLATNSWVEWSSGSEPLNPVHVWRVQEVLCLLGQQHARSQSILKRTLPEPSQWRGETRIDHLRLYASVRLTDIYLAGCGGPWWEEPTSTIN